MFGYIQRLLAPRRDQEQHQPPNTQDPFGTKAVAKLVEQAGGVKKVTLHELKRYFPCPSSDDDGNDDRISLPDLRNKTQVTAFRDNGSGFLFFQHLRKAGGTNFCTLAQANLPLRLKREKRRLVKAERRKQGAQKKASAKLIYPNDSMIGR